MLDAVELAKRFREAADLAGLTGMDIAKKCGVTPQAVSGWRKTGRIHKRHLEQLAELTGKPLDYFLNHDLPHGSKKAGTKLAGPSGFKEHIVDSVKFLIVMRAWQDSGPEGRRHMYALAKSLKGAHAPKRRRDSAL